MTIQIKDSGAWKPSAPYVRDAGVWKLIADGYVKDSGLWKSAWGAPTAGWNTAKNGDGAFSFSDGNRMATVGVNSGSRASVVTNLPLAGKIYVEIEIRGDCRYGLPFVANNDFGVDTSGPGDGTSSINWSTEGWGDPTRIGAVDMRFNGASYGGGNGGNYVYTSGQAWRAKFALDAQNNRLWYGGNNEYGGWWGYSGGWNPATGVGGWAIPAGLTGQLYLGVCFDTAQFGVQTLSAKACFHGFDQLYPAPAGFSALP